MISNFVEHSAEPDLCEEWLHVLGPLLRLLCRQMHMFSP